MYVSVVCESERRRERQKSDAVKAKPVVERVRAVERERESESGESA